jgi:hypothetical protein
VSRPLREWLRRSPSDLEALGTALDETELHPIDRRKVEMCRRTADFRGSRPDVDSLLACVRDLDSRYSGGLPDHTDRIAEIRAQMRPSRGPGVDGLYGTFRRGDLVSKPEWRAPDKAKSILDAVFIEAEPSSDHAKAYGRMAAVHVLGREHLDRWFLSDIRHGRELGRPW